MATYYLAANFKSPFMPWVAFAALMAHMLYLHAYRELFPRPGVVDITGAQMVLVMKVCCRTGLYGLLGVSRGSMTDYGIVDCICLVRS